jgi:hypothetical protein
MFRNQWRDKGKDLVWLYHDNSILSSSNETNIRHDLYTRDGTRQDSSPVWKIFCVSANTR